MKLYLLSENNTTAFIEEAEIASENFMRKNISGVCLLDGNLFENRKINNEWYVDYIKFCDMFGVELTKYTSEDDKQVNALLNSANVSLGYDTGLNFNKNPYYIRMYSGTTLNSIYQKVIRGQDTYFYDYTTLKIKDADFWKKVDEGLDIVEIQSKNILSNVINDWNGFTSAYCETYSSEDHYTESLLNIANYMQYIIKNNDAHKDLYTFSDLLESLKEMYSTNLELELNALSLNENLKNYVDYVNALAENNNDYKKALQAMAGSPETSGVALSTVKVLINSVSSFIEVNDTCQAIQNLGSDKRNMLNNGIIENEKLEESAEKMEIVLKVGNILGKITNGNYSIKAILNSIDNPKGLKDSAEKIYNMYDNIGKQTLEKLEAVSKTALYSISDELIQMALMEVPETVPIAIAMSIIDGSMALAKSVIGEDLKDAENLAQYYYIEQRLLHNLNESNPEILHSNLTFALMTSLCCYETKKKITEREIENLSAQGKYDNFFEEQMDDLDNTINNISEVLYELDHSKTKLCVDYYHNPRNNNVSDEIKNSILNYQIENNNGTISGKVLTKDKNPIKNAKIEVYTASDNTATRFGEDECYSNAEGEFSISMPEGKYLLVVTCDGYDPVNIEAVTVEKKKTKRVDNIYMKLSINNSDLIDIENAVFQREGENDDYKYNVYDKYIEITKYKGSDVSITIPAEIEGLPVAVISRTFEDCSSLKSINIPDSVTTTCNCFSEELPI